MYNLEKREADARNKFTSLPSYEVVTPGTNEHLQFNSHQLQSEIDTVLLEMSIGVLKKEAKRNK